MSRVAAAHAAIVLSGLLLSACGGGGGEAPPAPPPVTALPDIVSVSAPTNLDVTTPTSFKTSLAAPGSGIKFAWTFGDGGTSTEAAPSYSYPKGGDYEVTLKVTNEAGSTREAKYRLTVNNAAHVKGLECSGASGSGWCWEYPKPTGSERRDVFFLDAKTGWMVGVNGEIFKTGDGGVSWTRQNSGINATLTFVRFLDAQTGWAMGDFGALLRTKDGGATWQLSKLPFEANYYGAALQVISADKLLFTEYYGGGYASADGGTSWTRFDMQGTAVSAQGVIWGYQNGSLYKSADLGATKTKVLELPFANESVDLKLVGEATVLLGRWVQTYDPTANKYVTSYTLHTSKDGGSSWQEAAPKGFSADNGMPRMLQASAEALLSLQGSMLYRSVDGGRNWIALAPPGTIVYWDSSAFQLIDANTLAYVGYGYNVSTYSITEDGGATWTDVPAPEPGNYSRPLLRMTGPGAWLARTDTGHYLSADRGKTWTLAVGLPYTQRNQSFRTSWFFDTKRALVVTDQGELKETTDGGQSWKVKLNELSFSYGLAKLQFVSAKTGWLAADGRLYRSSDGGASWNSGPGAANFADFQFIDENLGWGRRSGSSSGDLLQTKDGGQVWTKVGEWPASGATLRFRDASNGLVGGSYGQIYQTADAGKTWAVRYSGTSEQISQIQYVDDKLVWAVSSGSVLQSTDGGSSWKIHRPSSQSAGWRSLAFVDADHGWVVGSAGAVVATEDGGKTWIQQSSGTTRSLSSVQFIDSKAGWIIGEQATILTTGTGGN